MVKKTVVTLIDDIDGEAADETATFALNGQSYEIDLSNKNAKDLQAALDPWIAAGRKTGRQTNSVKMTRVATEVDPKAVRIWAASNRVDLPARGRSPLAVVEQYRAAGN